MTEREFLTAVYSFIEFGPAHINLLLRYFKKPSKIWKAKTDDLLKIGLSIKKVANFEKFRSSFNLKNYFEDLEKRKVGFVTYLDKDYPENLKEIDFCPVVLYYKGVLKPKETNLIAIVGARKMTSYGREVAEKFAKELAGFGITIVSGLARGIDTIAHKAALSVGGRTIAVLGNGLDTIYPPENRSLALEIIKLGGAIISEYPLGYPALPINFANRNRIISGLSRSIVVVEGAKKSGTLLTATHAAEQGRTVFAIPGPITSPMSEAPLFLLKNGARIATSPQDILSDLNFEIIVDKKKIEKVFPENKEEEKIIEVLASEPMHLDELVRITGYATSKISARLTIMEMKGLVKNMGGGIYRKI